MKHGLSLRIGRKTLALLIENLERTRTRAQIGQFLFRHDLDQRFNGANKLSALGNVFHPIATTEDENEIRRAREALEEITIELWQNPKSWEAQPYSISEGQYEHAQNSYLGFRQAIKDEGYNLREGRVVATVTPEIQIEERGPSEILSGKMLRQRILKYLLDKERETSGAIPELGDIAQNVGASKEDVSDQIDILDSNGAVKANRTFGGGAAPMLTGSGKALLEELNEGLGSHQSTHRQIGAANNSSGVRPFGWDVFICHASEDKAAFVEQLAHQLRQKGLRVWYDDFTLKLGDSLRRSIDNGLKTSMYGIVVLSPRFFEKNWPQKELDGLVIRERDGKKVILPVWLNVGANDVEGYSPTLADRVAANVKDGMQKVVEQILAVVI